VYSPILVCRDTGIISKLVQDLLGSFSYTSSLQVDSSSIMRPQIVSSIEERRAVFLNYFPVSSAWQNLSAKFRSFKHPSLYMSAGSSWHDALKITFMRLPYGPLPIGVNDSISHWRWNRNSKLGFGNTSRWEGWSNLVCCGLYSVDIVRSRSCG
jgi:hypothetical protein